MKILMLCLEFPPVNTTGNYRSAGFARYLCKNNVETVVLTGTVDTLVKSFDKKADDSLLKGLEKAKIYRFPIAPIKPLWSKGIGDKVRIWWNISDKIDKRWYFGENKKKIDAIIKKERPDLFYVSLPPFSVARTALEISKKFNLPLITDMRDGWSLWVSLPFSTRFHYKKVLNVERRLFKQSKLIMGVTPELMADFKQQHPSINANKFKTIFNGYDDLKFENTEALKKDSVYKIGYIGSFYYHPGAEKIMNDKWYKRKGLNKLYYAPRKEQWKYRSPYFFLKSLSILLEKKTELRSKIMFEYVGTAPKWFDNMIKDLGLNDNFIHHGFVPKEEVLRIQSSWDAILATSEKIPDGDHFCLPSKLFDVVNSKKRILAFLTPGSQLNFLKDYSQVVFFQPDEFEDNVTKLKELVEKKDVSFKTDELSLDFHRENTAKQFYEELMKL
jgi:glycosyltransferase involved in cell wall biosynthesis